VTSNLVRVGACWLILQGACPTLVLAQNAAPSSDGTANTEQAFNTEQIDALLAPIALYPDTLLTQILMASTFPVQLVQASRWLDDPAKKSLSGDALTKALEAQTWDASVKSLVPFPQVVAMMNDNLDWTQQLGYAVASQQAAVLDSVQRLRRQAQTNGSLQTTPQQVVRTEEKVIVIEPAKPDVVYVPSYNPTAVYGGWPYPAYPPTYLPPAYPVGTALATGLAFGAGVAITAGLWGWAQPSWNGGSVNINTNRYNNINTNRTRTNSNVWQANRPGGRPTGMARAPGGPVGQPARSAGLPANAIGRQQVSVPRNAVNATSRAPAAGSRAAAGQARDQRNPGNRTNASPAADRPAPRASSKRTLDNGALAGISDGRNAAQFAQRGGQSRAAAQGVQRSSGGFSGGRAPGAGRGGGGRR
jgi:hypothetical protein